MNEVKRHTPGPWVFESGMIVTVAGADGWEICDMRDDVPALEGNAHLIAASPDLLEALTEMMDGYLYGCPMDVKRENVERARTAIAKARGQI